LWLRTAHSPRVPHFGFNVPGAANLLEDPIDRSIVTNRPLDLTGCPPFWIIWRSLSVCRIRLLA
jgi:hypothetical protein